MSWLPEVFGTERPVVGMVHFPALPHTPLHDRDGGISKIVDVVERDLAALVDAGFDAVMFCNEADRPYALEAPIEAVATMSAVVARLAPELPMDEESSIVDDRLRLIFTCCHPALDMSARVALTLRTLGGMTTGEIARAFLVAELTMGKRIVLAKRKKSPTRTSPTGCRPTTSCPTAYAACCGSCT